MVSRSSIKVHGTVPKTQTMADIGGLDPNLSSIFTAHVTRLFDQPISGAGHFVD